MDLVQLEKLIKLCRKLGVTSLSFEGVSVNLSPDAPESPYKRRKAKIAPSPFEQALSEAKDATTRAKIRYNMEQAQAAENQKTEGPSELDLLLWSAGNADGAAEQ